MIAHYKSRCNLAKHPNEVNHSMKCTPIWDTAWKEFGQKSFLLLPFESCSKVSSYLRLHLSCSTKIVMMVNHSTKSWKLTMCSILCITLSINRFVMKSCTWPWESKIPKSLTRGPCCYRNKILRIWRILELIIKLCSYNFRQSLFDNSFYNITMPAS